MSTVAPTAVAPATTVPELEQGDRLSRSEFERRYLAMPHLKKAELIEGTVHMPSPVHHERHGKPHADLLTWVNTYAIYTPGLDVSDNSTVRLDWANEPQPDILMRIPPDSGGQSTVTEDDYIEGAPEFAAEIASSSASYDRHQKKRVYHRNNVRSYLIWVTKEQRVEWFEMAEGEYRELEPDADGALKSGVFPGLWLDVSALLAGDMPKVLERGAEGRASAGYADFAKKLRG